MSSSEACEDMAIILAAQMCAQAIQAVVCSDGRRAKRPRSTIFTIRNNVWEGVEACESGGWFERNLRVTRNSFDQIVDLIERYMSNNQIAMPAENAFVDFRMSAAITLAYLAQEGGFTSVASLFGVSKATTIRSVNHVLGVLVRMAADVIRFGYVYYDINDYHNKLVLSFPKTSAGWLKLSAEFEEKWGYPDVAGAIDGSLFKVERPYDYEGYLFIG
jgi:hypothetical protein